MEVCWATVEDVPQIHCIVSYYVLNSVATYDEPIPVKTFKSRIERSITDERLPFFIAAANYTILKYAHGSEYPPQAGITKTIEDSIFSHYEHQKRGLGEMLMKH